MYSPLQSHRQFVRLYLVQASRNAVWYASVLSFSPSLHGSAPYSPMTTP